MQRSGPWFWCILPVLALLALLAGWPSGIVAQSSPPPGAPGTLSRDQRLDALFERLKETTDEAEGRAVVADIWKAWMQSGNAEIDEAMARAVLAMGPVPGLALPILDDIVARMPDWAEGWNKRATALFLLGEYERSLADIERVLALEPRHFGALAGLGLIRMNQGETREALAAFRRALAINPFLTERHSIIPALEKEVGDKPI